MKVLALFLSAIAGFSIWALSKPITGQVEPWDASASYLPLGILFCSILLALVFRKESLMVPLGILAGQMVFLFWHLANVGGDPLFGIGLSIILVLTAIFSLLPAFLISKIGTESGSEGE
ncbi:MAG: hypothetical protein AAGJ81_16010 [Verrucomicrobiota bacterium]